MSIKRQRAKVLVLALGTTLVAAAAASSADESPGIFAIGRYTLPTNKFHDLYDHVESLEPGGIKYDREFRHPHLPPGPVVVDCQETHRIGVTLAVASPPKTPKTSVGPQGKSPSSWSKRFKVKYRWSHSEDDGLNRSEYVTPNTLGPENILSSGMTLTRKTRVDGVWSVDVTYQDEVVYRTAFELVRCPDANAS